MATNLLFSSELYNSLRISLSLTNMNCYCRGAYASTPQLSPLFNGIIYIFQCFRTSLKVSFLNSFYLVTFGHGFILAGLHSLLSAHLNQLL